MDRVVEDLTLDGQIVDFEIPLIWDAHASGCVERYQVLRAPGQMATPDTTAIEAYASTSTAFADIVTGPGIYTYFVVGLTADDLTTPPSNALTLRIAKDGSGEIVTGSSADHFAQRLYGSYIYSYDYEETYYNVEDEILTFYEAHDGTTMLRVDYGYSGLDTSYYSGGRCLDLEYGSFEGTFAAGPDTLTLQLDGVSIDLEYTLTDGLLELDGVPYQPLDDGTDSLQGCFAIAMNVTLDYPSDSTAHFEVEVDTDAIPGNTDSIDYLRLDYGDGDSETMSVGVGSYDLYHSINKYDLPVEYDAMVATVGGLYLHYWGEYFPICDNPDAYENNNSYSSATTLISDAPPLDLTFTDSADWFAADLSAGTHYRFRTNPTSIDSEMWLYDTDGSTELDYADESYGSAAAIDFTPAEDGIYYLRVREFYAPQCNEYTLVLLTP